MWIGICIFRNKIESARLEIMNRFNYIFFKVIYLNIKQNINNSTKHDINFTVGPSSSIYKLFQSLYKQHGFCNDGWTSRWELFILM